jgi:outer membrane protein assembly factor BamD (BamD/ComL family)
MSRFAAILTAAAVALSVSGCGKKSEAEKQEEDRDKLRETKRENAVKYYKTISEKFPESEHAQEALQKAKALEAAAKKK